MHFLLITTEILNTILETIVFKQNDCVNNFVFHLLCDINNSEDSETITFQANYSNEYYTNYTIAISELLFFDSLEFRPIVLNYDQCLKLIQLTKMFEKCSIGFCLNSCENIEVVVSHSNVKLVFPIDNEIDHNPIIPPEHNLDISFIPINTELLKNVVTLVNSPKFYTSIRVDRSKSRLIFGDEGSFQSIVQLPRTLNLSDSIIEIEPDSIILFLSNLKIKQVEIKVNKKIAFIIHATTELGEIYYYRGHELD